MSATPNQTLPIRESPNSQSAGEVIWASAKQAAGSAFLVWLLGGLALGIAGAFAGHMIPSPPPLHSGAEAETVHWWFGRHWLQSMRAPAFAVLFLLFFAHSLWVAYRDHKGAAAAGRVEFIFATLRANWFGIIVRNAVVAWAGALVLVWVSRFSLTQIFWSWLCGFIFSSAHWWGGAALGRERWAGIEEWFRWFGVNQVKLYFWFLYFAGICDDLGLPNIKTLGRWLWRRWKKRNAATSAADIECARAPVVDP